MPNHNSGSDTFSRLSRRSALKTGATIAVASSAGCLETLSGGSGNDGGNGDPEITILSSETDPNSQEFHEEIAQSFGEETGYTVSWEYVSFEEMTERLSAVTRGGTPPELFDGNVSTLGTFMLEGWLRPQTDLLGRVEESLGAEIPEAMLLTEEDEVYSIPFAHKMQNQTIRGDLVEEVGAEVQNFDVDWETHLEWVQQIDEGTDVAGIGLSVGRVNKAHQDTLQYLWTNGVKVFSGPTDSIEVVLDQDENRDLAIEVLEYMNQLWEYSPQVSDWGWGETGEEFASGSIADVNYPVGRMIANARAQDQEWAVSAPEFVEPPYQQHRDDGIELITAPTGFALMEDSEYADEAEEFLEYLLAGNDGDNVASYCASVPFHLSPTMEPIAQNENYAEHEVVVEREEIIEQQNQLLDVVCSPALTGDDFSFNPLAPPAYNEGTLGVMAAEVLANDMDPGEAVDQAAEELRGFGQ